MTKENPTRQELRDRWTEKNDKCKVCQNASECEGCQNGVQWCKDFIITPGFPPLS